MGVRRLLNTTIASSQTTSGEIDLSGDTLVGIQMPATFTGTAITFTGATVSGGTFQAITDKAGVAVSVTVAGGKFVVIPPDTIHAPFVKIVSGSTESQADTLTLVLLPLGWR